GREAERAPGPAACTLQRPDMTTSAARVTIAFALAALALPAVPARAQAVEGSTQVEQEPNSPGEGRVGHTGADFYRDLDRSDLAERYERRMGWKYLGGFVGGAAMAAGLVWGEIDLFNTDWQNNFRCCGSAKPIGGAHASPYPWITAGAGL